MGSNNHWYWRRYSRALIAVLACAHAIAGCALSPQTVPLEPTLAIDETNLGQGRSIALDTVDNRANKTIGTRGGVYASTSTITAAGDIRAALRKSMADALTKLGFNVVEPGASADLRMQVGLESLTYVARGEPVVNAIETGATVSSTVERAGQTYRGRAGITKSRNVLKAPAPVDNEAYINDTLALALEKLLADQRFIEFVR